MELNNVSNVIAHIFSEHQIRTTRVAAGVSGHSVIVKNIVLPQMSQEELQESFSWHAEEHIPFDIGDVNLDYELTGKSSESLHVLMAACKSDKINNVKQAIQLAGKQPVIIDVDAFALQNCYEVNYSAASRRDRCAAEHRRGDDEYQHPQRHAFDLRAETLQSAAASTRACCRKNSASVSNRQKQ